MEEFGPVVCAIDIGGTKFEVGLVTLDGALIDRERGEVDPDVGPQSHLAMLAALVSSQLVRAREHHRRQVLAIGIGCAGPIEPNCATVSPVNIASWNRFPLQGHLEELTGLRVFGDLDAKALALAEGWLGAAIGVRNFCAMTVSTGIGGGIVIDGELVDGDSGNAGHVGHVIVEPGGHRCGCGARGCLEAEASGLAVQSLTGRPATEPTYEIMQHTGRLVGRGAAMLCNSLDLDLVVIGGGVALGFGATFFLAAQTELDLMSQVTLGPPPRIVQTKLGDRGPLVGAGAVALRGLGRVNALDGR
ncbi:MAG: ROK family protein [Ilumatobacteraceae bacterium]|jgi:glucokinase|nr:ROK family protein [Actinomycetota bacterium]